MGIKLNLDETHIINEYLKGKSSLVISKEMGVSKPTILKILNKHNIVRKRDRCDKLDIEFRDGHFYIQRFCPVCNDTLETKSIYRTIACRNHLNKIKNARLCKNCLIKSQMGEGNPFYGKKHTNTTKELISKSRKGKGMGVNNAMHNPDNRRKLAETLKKNGTMVKWNF